MVDPGRRDPEPPERPRQREIEVGKVDRDEDVFHIGAAARSVGPFSFRAEFRNTSQDLTIAPGLEEIVVPGAQGGTFERQIRMSRQEVRDADKSLYNEARGSDGKWIHRSYLAKYMLHFAPSTHDKLLWALDDPVAEYVPSFAQNGKGEVRIRHLMTHTSGLTFGFYPFVIGDLLFQHFPALDEGALSR